MTTTVSKVTTTAITTHSFSTLTTTVGLIAIGILIVLLVQKELLRAVGGPRAAAGARIANAAIAPLLLTLFLTVIVRIVPLVHIV